MPNGNVKGVPQSQADKYKQEQICKEELLPLHNLFAFIVTPVHSDYPAFPVQKTELKTFLDPNFLSEISITLLL